MAVEKLLASVLEVNDSNDIYMSLDILLLTSVKNKNNCRFEPDFIHEVVKSKDKYIAIPLVCEKGKLEKGKNKQLGHALKKSDGTLNTEQIGSFVDFYEKENEDGSFELYGQARIMKRYSKVCSAILNLFEEKLLFFSVEVLVGEYKKGESKNIRVVDVSENNILIGDCIVSFPAETKSKCYTLVAEALNKDLGGENLEKVMTIEDFFKDTKVKLENSELDIYQVQKKVYAKWRLTMGEEEYWDYYSTDFGINYMIVQNYKSGDYYRIDFTVSNDDVEAGEMYKVTKNYVVAELNKNTNKEEIELMELKDLKDKLELSEKEVVAIKAKLVEKESLISEKDKSISEKDVSIAEINEKLNTLSESVVLKDAEIAELLPIKSELEVIKAEKVKIEKSEKSVELKTKYSKLLSEEVLATKEIAEAIENLDETVLQTKVTDLALEKAEVKTEDKDKSKDKKTVTASITDDIKVGGSGDIVSKYITINR